MRFEAGKIYTSDGYHTILVHFIDPDGTAWGQNEYDRATCILKSNAGNWNEYTEPKPVEYVPYEWSDRDELRGRWCRCKATKSEIMIQRMKLNISQAFLLNGFNASWLLENYEWLDGTPCGKVK